MLNIAIPCVLSPNNLPKLKNNASSKFVILTTEKDRDIIVKAKAFELLKTFIKVEIVICEWMHDQKTGYWLRMSRGHQIACLNAVRENAYCIFLAPDFLISDGSLDYLYQKTVSGIKAVLIPGLRVNADEIIIDFLKEKFVLNGEPIDFKPRKLVALALNHIHDEDLRYNWDHKYFSQSPVVCTWNIPEEKGYLVRAFHLHPILVQITSKESIGYYGNDTIDGNFVGHNVTNWDAIHVAQDSDDIVMFSLTRSYERQWPLIPNLASAEALSVIADSNLCNALHRFYFTKSIRIHTDDLNEKWENIESSTGALAYTVLSKHRGPENNNLGPENNNLMKIRASILLSTIIKKIIRRIKTIYWNYVLHRSDRTKNKYKKLEKKYNELYKLYVDLKRYDVNKNE